MTDFHTPVLLQTALSFLRVQPSGKYIDCTLGAAGHSAAIIEAGGEVLGIDQDPQALDAVRSQEALQPALASGALILVQSNFSHITELSHQHSWTPVQGILADLGVSSHQINTPSRGFSFQQSGPLDMRMDPTLSVTAAQLVNTLPSKDLAHLLDMFGEIPASKLLAAKIVAKRPISTTAELATISGKWSRNVFQALRIAVNDELGSLTSLLDQSLPLLSPGGRLVIISFHSLEDRLVKRAFTDWENSGQGLVLTPKPATPSPQEVSLNSRSKSAKLRAFEKK